MHYKKNSAIMLDTSRINYIKLEIGFSQTLHVMINVGDVKQKCRTVLLVVHVHATSTRKILERFCYTFAFVHVGLRVM